MGELKHAPFRLLKLMGGLVLIVLGAGLFVLFTGELNVARSNGSPMNMGYLFEWWPVMLVLDLIFLSLILGGVKLAGFSWSVFGWIIIVIGIGVLCRGIWNQIDGPPIDYDSTSTDERFPASPEQHAIVYIWAGVTMLGGLLLTAFAIRATRK